MHRGIAPLPPRWLAVLSCLALAVLGLAAPCPARAQTLGPISPAVYFPPSGYRPKEFTLVRKDGWFHIFYIRENLAPGAPTEQSLGHAISRDLYTWAEQDTILPVLPGTYEGTQIWAPHLVQAGDTWHLFYTAMHDDPANGIVLAQSITEATSTDLYHWTRRDQPLFDNTIFPWAFHDTTAGGGRDCRDPFVWWDATHGEWLMYVSTRPASNPSGMVIGILASTDLEHWTDQGFIPITLPSVAFSNVAESSTLFQGDPSTLVFVWTTDSGNALTYGTSPDAITGWGNPARLRSMLGYTTLGWWATESLVDGARQYLGSVDDSWLQFWDLTWTSSSAFRLAAPERSQILDAGFDRAHAVPGDTAQVIGRMVHGAGHSLALRWVRYRGNVADTLSGGAFGLPDTLALAADSAAAPVPVTLALAGGTGCLLTVRPANGTAAPESLLVTVPDSPFDDPPLDPDPVPQKTRLILVLRRGEVRFVKDGATAAWRGEVFDVRGRKLWRGDAAAGQKTLVWRPGGMGDGASAPVGPGIYFARVSEDGRPPELLKVPWVPVR